MRPKVPASAQPMLWLASAAGVLSGLAVLAQANLFAIALADAFGGRSIPVGVLLGALAAVAVRALGTFGFGSFGQRAAGTVGTALRTELLGHLRRLGPDWVAGQQAGALTTLLTRGLTALDSYVRDYLPQLAAAAVLPVAVLVQLAIADPISAVVVLVTLPLVPVFGVLAGARAKQAADRQWATLSRLGGHFLDAVAGLPTLALFGRARAHAQVVRELAQSHHRATMRTLRLAFLSALALELVASLSVALVAVPVALRLLSGSLDLRTALLVLLVVPEAYLPLRLLGQRFHAATEALAVFKRIDEIRALPSAESPTGTAVLPAGPLSVEFDAVTVSRPGRPEPVLCNASGGVGAGEWLAIAGPSGAGKSTALALLLGFLKPDNGTVRIGGHELSTVDIDQLRRRVAWLPQRPHLFAGTVGDNVALGAPQATDEQLHEALALAGAAEFVAALPAGVHTELGARGAGLSTGQRQRLALARLLLRVRVLDPAVVLLDEPTAGLDLTTESAVLAGLRRALAGRTVLVVAHRPAVLAVAERVLVVRDRAFVSVTESVAVAA